MIDSRQILLIILVSRLLDLQLILRVQGFFVTFRGFERNVELSQPFRKIRHRSARECVRHTACIVQPLDDRAREVFELHVDVSNLPAIKLYESLGFEIKRVISRYYEHGEDAYYMLKIVE